MKNVVIVGGGAGGIELATFLGDKLGRKKHGMPVGESLFPDRVCRFLFSIKNLLS